MYRKKLIPKPRRNKKSRAVYVDGEKFPSLFLASVEFCFSYGHFFNRLSQNGWEPITYSGHLVITEKWLKQNKGQLPLFAPARNKRKRRKK